MNSFEIRKKFIKFFKKHNHKRVSSSSLIPQKDPSLLFVNAGMNQFKDVFLGLKTPPFDPVVTIQKCLRAGGKHNDLENVGQTSYHHTFFEMMGNFSFGSYSKKEAINLAWLFLTKELHLSERNLFVSVFKEDKEAFRIWNEEQGLPAHKIFLCGEEDNFWKMGETGPCGPCSEIYFYKGKKKQPSLEDMVEIWNLVFMEWDEEKVGKLKPLPKPCIDTGMGLERLTSVLQNKSNNYHTDIFRSIIEDLEQASGADYDFTEVLQDEKQMAFQVVADHSRAAAFLISDGILPGNEGRNYVLRRILRRAFFYSQKLHPKKNLLKVGVKQVIHSLKTLYPELQKTRQLILTLIQEEEEKFLQNLVTGRKVFLKKIKNLKSKQIDTKTLWELYSTYGFPVDLTRLMAKEQGLEVEEGDLEQFKNQEVKPSYSEKKDIQSLQKKALQACIKTYPHQKTLFTGYEKRKEQGQILLLWSLSSSQSVKTLDAGEEALVILDKSCFYPEGGGPIGDEGVFQTSSGKAKVEDCQKEGDIFFHRVKVKEGNLNLNQEVSMEVSERHRRLIATSHSATHLLNQALRKVLSSSLRQAGSLVLPGRLRFDFTHSKPLTEDQLEEIEKEVQSAIQNPHSSQVSFLPYEEALKQGYICMAGENYPSEVRVIEMGKSRELCGGIHVANTKDIQKFKIISETGVQSGVRRIVAYTSEEVERWLDHLTQEMNLLKKQMDFSSFESFKNPFIAWVKSQREEIKQLKAQLKNLKSEENANKTGLKEEEKKGKSETSLAFQNQELRKFLNLPLPKEEERESLLKNHFQKQKEEVKALKAQLKKLKSFSLDLKSLREKSHPFSFRGVESELLLLSLPIEDKKLLSETADQLKSKISSGVVVLLGQGQEQHPLVVTLTSSLKEGISAGDLFKNVIAPCLKGKGGGNPRFAQGQVEKKEDFYSLKELLLNHFKNSK